MTAVKATAKSRHELFGVSWGRRQSTSSMRLRKGILQFIACIGVVLSQSQLTRAQDAVPRTLPTPVTEKPSIEISAGTSSETPASAKRHATPATIPEAVANDPRRRVLGSAELTPLPSAPIPGQTPGTGEPVTPAPKAKQGTSAKRQATPAATPEAVADDLTPLSSAKAEAISAPLPLPPYQATHHTTGANHHFIGYGICLITVDTASGKVTGATMEQTTGNAILDKTTTDTFRQWRFKRGMASRVRVPVTYNY
jgi:hypothetical protein